MTNSSMHDQQRKPIPHIAFVGYSGSGKTTVASQVVARLQACGLRIAVLKHDVHGFDMDTEGKDTWTYDRSGADIVMIASPGRLNYMEKYEKQPPLSELLSYIREADLILVEGFKKEAGPKILVARTEEHLTLLKELRDTVAIVTPLPLAGGTTLPVFLPEQAAELARWIVEQYVQRCGSPKPAGSPV